MRYRKCVESSLVYFTSVFRAGSRSATALFQDMERQHLKLMDMIAAIVGALDRSELFQSIISYTGHQHADFGAQLSHFVAFGDALIWSWNSRLAARLRRS